MRNNARAVLLAPYPVCSISCQVEGWGRGLDRAGGTLSWSWQGGGVGLMVPCLGPGWGGRVGWDWWYPVLVLAGWVGWDWWYPVLVLAGGWGGTDGTLSWSWLEGWDGTDGNLSWSWLEGWGGTDGTLSWSWLGGGMGLMVPCPGPGWGVGWDWWYPVLVLAGGWGTLSWSYPWRGRQGSVGVFCPSPGWGTTPPPRERANEVKTLPSLVLCTRAVIRVDKWILETTRPYKLVTIFQM